MKNHLIRCEAYRNSVEDQPVYSLQTAGAAAGPIAPDIPGFSTANQYPPQKPSEAHDAQNPGPALPPPASGASPVQDPGAPGPSHEQDLGAASPAQEQDPNATAMDTSEYPSPSGRISDAQAQPPGPPPPGPPPPGPPGSVARPRPRPSVSGKVAKKNLDTVEKIRRAMGRSTRRMESLEAVLKTQIADGMSNAATHVRAAIRDERDRLFKLSQSLVRQEVQVRDTQSTAIHY